MTEQKTVLSGMRSTGKIHLGNYFGALKNWVDLQDRYRCYYFAADWHALTSDYADPSEIAAEHDRDGRPTGSPPASTPSGRRSSSSRWCPSTPSSTCCCRCSRRSAGWSACRPTRSRSSRSRTSDLSTYGFLGYPVLQTVDIAIYRAHFVPVGEDQASHLEISREIVRRFNYLYGEVFPEPQALFTPAAKVPGIDGRKMSKSYGNAINLSDPPEVIRAEVHADVHRSRSACGAAIPAAPRSATSTSSTSCCRRRRSRSAWPASAGRRRSAASTTRSCWRRSSSTILEPIRRRREELVRDRDTVYDILVEGSRKARERTAETMEAVRDGHGARLRKVALG